MHKKKHEEEHLRHPNNRYDYEYFHNNNLDYFVTHINQTLENLQIVTTEEKIELELKKSCKGIKIKGVEGINNFKINYPAAELRGIKTNTTAGYVSFDIHFLFPEI